MQSLKLGGPEAIRPVEQQSRSVPRSDKDGLFDVRQHGQGKQDGSKRKHVELFLVFLLDAVLFLVFLLVESFGHG
jgi:hypothetical protein